MLYFEILEGTKEMQYIPQQMRPFIDDEIDDLVSQMKMIPGYKEKRRGIFNYVICRIGWKLLEKEGYIKLSGIRAAMDDASDEWYRRLMGPYEDKAIKKNGDVFDI